MPINDSIQSKRDAYESAAAEHSERLEAAAQAAANLAVTESALKDLHVSSREAQGAISPLELVEATASVELAKAVLVGAEERASDAADMERQLLVELVAEEVADTATPEKVDQRVQRARRKLSAAIAEMRAAVVEPNALSDDAGKRLAAAGVPTQTTIGRVRYRPMTGFTGDAVRGRYNVQVDGEWLSVRSDPNSEKRAVERVVADALTEALTASGLVLGANGVATR